MLAGLLTSSKVSVPISGHLKYLTSYLQNYPSHLLEILGGECLMYNYTMTL